MLVEKILLARWQKMTILLHYLGFALRPRFYDVTLPNQNDGNVRERKTLCTVSQQLLIWEIEFSVGDGVNPVCSYVLERMLEDLKNVMKI
uniref:Uncharacterized protein n=1 Tax=Lactuca sativa TaxID=4236 RepID=A0A9R1VE21_LACSA|nr:hypothetical protein LSAT_V11C500248390 [Lactuca sativa]